jgi:hypothetical protein
MAAKAEGKARVADGSVQQLIDQAKKDFPNLDPSFTVSKQTVDARIQTGRHNIFHPGTPSPVQAAEPILVAMITTAYKLDAPMYVKQCKAAMNEMLQGTRVEAEIIAQCKKGTYNPN